MTEVVTLTVGAIAALAFKKFIEESSAGIANRLTPVMLEKIGKLRDKILEKIGQIPEVDALSDHSEIDDRQIALITPHLEEAMRGDTVFAQEIRQLAGEINKEGNIDQILDQNKQNVYGGSVVQINNPEAPVFTGDISGGSFNFTWNK